MDPPRNWTPTRREVLGAATGAALALAGFGHRARPGRRLASGPVALWAADRAGHGVYGIDADGLVVSRCPVIAPVEVLAAANGSCQVLSAVVGRLDGGRAWRRIAPDGRVSAPLPAPRVGRESPAGWEALVGAGAGPILDVTPPVLERRRTSVWVLRAAPEAGCRLECWVSVSDGPWVRAFRLAFPWDARAIAGSRAGVWVVGARSAEVRFVTSTGRIVISRRLEDLDGADAAVVAAQESGGGVWIAACGALARLDRTGRRLPGQGGFAHLVDLAAV